jgi:hypothetical protein
MKLFPPKMTLGTNHAITYERRLDETSNDIIHDRVNIHLARPVIHCGGNLWAWYRHSLKRSRPNIIKCPTYYGNPYNFDLFHGLNQMHKKGMGAEKRLNFNDSKPTTSPHLSCTSRPS